MKIKLSTVLRLVGALPVIVSAGKAAYGAIRGAVAKPQEAPPRTPFTWPLTAEELRVVGTREDPRLFRAYKPHNAPSR